MGDGSEGRGRTESLTTVEGGPGGVTGETSVRGKKGKNRETTT